MQQKIQTFFSHQVNYGRKDFLPYRIGRCTFSHLFTCIPWSLYSAGDRISNGNCSPDKEVRKRPTGNGFVLKNVHILNYLGCFA
jgi:hypothetical protein